MKRLTARQQEILDFITNNIKERGYPPTIREIGTAMGIRSTNGVNDHLKALERKGYLVRDDLKSRAMRPTNMQEDFIKIPVLGRVAAGEPILAIEDARDSVKVDRFFLGNHKEMFALRIVGDSMIEEGILDGDYIFVNKTPTAEKGAIVVAMIDGDATCKRYFPEPEKSRIRFQPSNAKMNPIYVAESDFRQTMILGQVIGTSRKY